MGKYAMSIGILRLNVGGITTDVKPLMGDNERVANVVGSYSKHKDQARMLKELGNFAFELITRSDSTLIEEDKQELKLAIELNQLQIMEDMLIAFKWTTKEDMDKAKSQSGDIAKNLMQREV